MNPQELAEYKQYLASQGFSPKEADEYIAESYKPETEASDPLKTGLDYGMRALDYGGGLVRTGAAGLANIPYAIKTGKSFVGPEDVMNALKGQAPSSAEYMERAGVPEGARLDLNPLAEGDTSVRDIVGFGADIATDPTTALALAAKPVAKGLLGTGKSLYKSGLKKIDEKLIEKGAKPVSEVLMKAGKWGSTKTLAKEADKLAKELGPKRAALYEKAKGAKFSSDKATEAAKGLIAEMRSNPGLVDQAQKLDEYVSKYAGSTPLDLQTASDWKSSFYDALPDSAHGPYGKVKSGAQEVNRALGSGYKNEIIRAADEVSPGLGKEIDALNEDWGALIGSQKPFQKQIGRQNTKNYVTGTDPILGGLGYTAGGGPAAAGLIAGKKLVDLTKTTGARTGGGLLLRKLGEAPVDIVDPIILRNIIEANRNE